MASSQPAGSLYRFRSAFRFVPSHLIVEKLITTFICQTSSKVTCAFLTLDMLAVVPWMLQGSLDQWRTMPRDRKFTGSFLYDLRNLRAGIGAGQFTSQKLELLKVDR